MQMLRDLARVYESQLWDQVEQGRADHPDLGHLFSSR